MKLMLMATLTILMLLIMLTFLISLISKKVTIDNQKATPFECGFNSMSYTRLPFSIHFFMIAVIFLIFDIEIILVLPMIITLKMSIVKSWLLTSISFVSILLLGLFHEWKNGMIKWTS